MGGGAPNSPRILLLLFLEKAISGTLSLIFLILCLISDKIKEIGLKGVDDLEIWNAKISDKNQEYTNKLYEKLQRKEQVLLTFRVLVPTYLCLNVFSLHAQVPTNLL